MANWLNRKVPCPSFEYDALGRRTSKTINGVQTDFQYDGNDIVAEIEGGAVGVSYLRSLSIDEPFVRQAETNEYYHVDALGSTLDLTDDTGAVMTSYEYEAFGKTTINGTSTNPFQYTGRENDGTGLYYYRARYYSPGLQRFVSEDPSDFHLFLQVAEEWSPIPLLNFSQLSPPSTGSSQVDILFAFSFSFGNPEIFPLPQIGFSRLSCGRAAGAPETFHLYTYVSNGPFNQNDPSGLGRPTECKKYDTDCAKGLNIYSCIARFPCKNANSVFGKVKGNKIRNCLLDEYRGGCTSIVCQIGAHKRYFSKNL